MEKNCVEKFVAETCHLTKGEKVKDQLNLRGTLGVEIKRRDSLPNDNVKLKGRFKVEVTRKDTGKIDTYEFDNDIVNLGKNYILDVMFHDQTQIAGSAWCIGLISSSGYSALAAADVMNSHAGWTEFTSYSQSTRVAWGAGSPSGQAITNGTPAQFDITATGTLKGVFITSQNTKSGTSGTLWATALFSADVPVNNGDQIKITYTVSS